MRKRLLACVLALAMATTLLPMSVFAATTDEPTTDPKSGVEFTKTVTDTGNGTYSVKMEAYATGETQTVTETKPCDIVLVLDVSGSMADSFKDEQVSYTAYNNKTNQDYYNISNNRNPNLWYKTEDGSYVRVYVTREELEPTWTKVDNLTYGDLDNGVYYARAKNSADNTYLPATLEYKRDWNNWDNSYYYLAINNQEIQKATWSRNESGWGWHWDVIKNDDYDFYVKNANDYTYTYSYEGDQSLTTIESVKNNNGTPTETYYWRQVAQINQVKMSAMQKAVTDFIDAVKASSPDGDYHNIAIVKFAGKNSDMTGDSTYKDGGYTYNYSQKVVELTKVDDTGVTTLKNAVNALDPAGATQANYGLNHAKSILDAVKNDGRQKVVVMFTDGSPTSSNGFERTVANDAIKIAKDLKDPEGINAKVYTVGVFKSKQDLNTNVGKYMHYVSSNYPNAVGLNNSGEGKDDGYYMMANNASDLQKIFTKISQDINSTTVTLDEKAVMKDVVANHFTIKNLEGITRPDISVYTCPFNGYKNDEPTWGEKTSDSKVSVSVDDGNTVSVTGFDYKANFIHMDGDEPQGRKLVVEFTIELKDDSLKGYLSTNVDDKAGIYESKDAKDPAFTAEVSKQDIKPVPVAAVSGKNKTVTVGTEVNLMDSTDTSTDPVSKDCFFNYIKPTITEDYKTNAGVNITYTIEQVADVEGKALANESDCVFTTVTKTVPAETDLTDFAPKFKSETAGTYYFKMTVTVTSINDKGEETLKDSKDAIIAITVDNAPTPPSNEGTLTIVKNVVVPEGCDYPTTYTFTVTNTDTTSASTPQTVEVTVTANGTNITGKQDIKLAPGTYKVEENTTAAAVEGCELNTTWSPEIKTVEITKDGTATVTVTNTYTTENPGPDPQPDTGTLTVTKTVIGPEGAGLSIADLSNDFTITLVKGDTTYTLKKSSTEEGIYSATVNNGVLTWTIEDAPYGTYAVTESNESINGYDCTNSLPENVFAFDKEKNTLDVTNTYSKSDGDTMNVEIPFTKEVKQGGNVNPGKQAFELVIVKNLYTGGECPDVKVTATVDTNGVNTYPSTLTISGPETQVESFISEGFFVQEKDTGATNWTYDDTVWYVVPKGPEVSVNSVEGATQSDGVDAQLVFDIYPTTVDKTGDVTKYVQNKEVDPVKQMTFTNTYTRNSGGGGGGHSRPTLNTEDHYGYVIGYPDGTVQPGGSITRAEVATIFFRMLTDSSRTEFWSQTNSFSDVPSTAWFNNAVSTLTKAGIIAGYEDGTFQPNATITRAEFATIAVRFFEASYDGKDFFTDIDGHWAQQYINDAANAGLVNGYEDGTFGPNKAITRAEAMTLVNRALDRHPDTDHFLKDMITWPDNSDTKAWYYEAVQEATNSHEYTMKTNTDKTKYENWTKMLKMRDWKAFEAAWSNANSASNPGEVMGK